MEIDKEVLHGILKVLNADQRAAVLHDHETDNQLLILDIYYLYFAR